MESSILFIMKLYIIIISFLFVVSCEAASPKEEDGTSTWDDLNFSGDTIKFESEIIEARKALVPPRIAKRNRIMGMKKSEYNPVIFIPGDGGSQLEARLNKTYRIHYICAMQSDWYDLWLNLHLLTPIVIDCLYDNLRLHYDPATKKTLNTEGVEVRPKDFGSLDGVSYLDSLHMPRTDYFETIIATLESNLGLSRDVDMLAASFDFRKAPNELAEHFRNLTKLIEKLYLQSGRKPITLICHSMGCLNSLYLLNGKSDSWKATHINRLITLGSPWSGSFKAISAMLFGDNLGIPLLDHNKLRTLQASFPSLMYLFPTHPAFSQDRVLIETLAKNYSLSNFDEVFEDTNLTDQMGMWHETRKITTKLKAPGVEVWCMYGKAIETPSKIKIESSFSEAISKWKYEMIQGDGDGTVNIESLEACKEFKNQQKQAVHIKEFPGVDHIAILRGQEPANFIAEQIFSRDLVQNRSSVSPIT